MGSHHLSLTFDLSHSAPRADPHANTEDWELTPIEIAVNRDNFEVLIILASFAEVPANKRLDFLGMIVEHEGEEQYAAEFKKNLEGFSVSEVMGEVWKSGFDQVSPPGAGEVAELALASQM